MFKLMCTVLPGTKKYLHVYLKITNSNHTVDVYTEILFHYGIWRMLKKIPYAITSV